MMKIHNTASKVFILSLALASFAHGQQAEASKLTITNHARSVLKINVVTVPKEKPYCQECLGSPLRGGETRTILVSAEGLKGKEFFSVVDATNGFVGESECKNLSVFKDYSLAFYETTTGTRCAIESSK